MIITCGQCQAKFKVAPEQIKETGSRVRCSECQYVFTVYRPQRPAPEAAAPRDPLDDLLESIGREGEEGGEGSAPGQPQRLDELFEDLETETDPRQRRERRRRLYSDLEDEPGKATFDDAFDDLDDLNEEMEGQSGQAHPPLRRGRPAPKPGDEDLSPPLEDPAETAADALGLTADPAYGRAAQGGQSPAPPPKAEGGPTIRAAVSPSGRNFLVIAGALALIVLAGIYYLSQRPAPVALSPEEDLHSAAPLSDDAAGIEHIIFTKNNQNHYFRENSHVGTILIITGMVRNDYPQKRSFIHLRGRLLSADKTTLADRYCYAGNLISEDELKTLPIPEIISRLSIKGGRSGQNMNIEPGREVPFMLVFDKLPDGMAEYTIETMGSSPAE